MPAESFGAIESVKAASDLNAPVSGKVVEINPAVQADFALVNSAAETSGMSISRRLLVCVGVC